MPSQAEEDARLVQEVYRRFQEDERLKTPAARVEYLTTMRCIEQELRPGARVLELGAGTGAYSLALAEKGFLVDAVELADENVRVFREKLAATGAGVCLRQGNALDLSCFADETFDAVFVFGPLYHLRASEDRARCLAEARRVLRPGGALFAAFIHHDMLFMTELLYNADYFSTDDYDHETMRLVDFPFVSATVPECRAMLTDAGLSIEREIASDGASELMAARVNALSEADYAQYLRYHFYRCEKPEMLGFSNHLLFVCRKKGEC